MRTSYNKMGHYFPLDRVALIGLSRIVQRPIRSAWATDQLGRVLAVSYSYPGNPDPVIPVVLADVGRQVNATLKELARHLEGYNEFHNQVRFGKKARTLVGRLALELEEVGRRGVLTSREISFVLYHAELSIAQPRRRN